MRRWQSIFEPVGGQISIGIDGLLILPRRQRRMKVSQRRSLRSQILDITQINVRVESLVRFGRRSHKERIECHAHGLRSGGHRSASVRRSLVRGHHDLLLLLLHWLLLLLYWLLKATGLWRAGGDSSEGHRIEAIHAVAVVRRRHHSNWRPHAIVRLLAMNVESPRRWIVVGRLAGLFNLFGSGLLEMNFLEMTDEPMRRGKWLHILLLTTTSLPKANVFSVCHRMYAFLVVLTVGSCVGGLVNVINEIAQFFKLISTVFPETLVDADEIIGSRGLPARHGTARRHLHWSG